MTSPGPLCELGGLGRLRSYLTRFQVASATVPIDVVGLVYFSSSAVSVAITRFWSRPIRFGKTLPSTCVMIVLSASLTVCVPKLATKPAKTGLARVLIVFCLGVATTLAWQSYGDAARAMIANSSPQLAWLAPQTAPVEPATAHVPAPAAAMPELQQLAL